jgi:alpha-tubulin suppressor-like RCC1 family protein
MERFLKVSILALVVLGLTSCGGGADVGPPSDVASVTMSPRELTLAVGESQQLTATPQDQAGNPLDGRTITWTTSEPSVADVSEAGMVSGIDVGTATITAASEGKSASAAVLVRVPVASVTVVPSELSLFVGQSEPLTAVVRDEAGRSLFDRSITWTTSAPGVVSISEAGVVSGIALGSATITAAAEAKTGSAAVSVVSSVTFSSIAAGGAHTCALTPSGAAYCWGRGESGQLGIPAPTTTCPTDAGPRPCRKVPVPVGGGLTFVQLAGGGDHTCGLTSDGTAYCWGNNRSGQLGEGPTDFRDSPAPVATELRFTSIDAGARHTCGLTGDGTAYCWGNNNVGQLGDETTTNSSVPVAVTGGHSFQLIVAGGFSPGAGDAYGHTCALTMSGDAYCWGDDESGQLGTGVPDLDVHPTPAPVTGELTFAGLSASLGSHTCGFTASGTGYCWGFNPLGGLGNGTKNDSPVPVPVQGGLAFVQIIAGGLGHTCGRTDSGKTYCWGDNAFGQVGDGSRVERTTPTPILGGLSFTRLDAGYRHTCGLATDGAVYCWGSGGAGQLGNNSTDRSNVPSKVFGQP